MLPRKTAIAIATFALIALLAPNIPGKEHLPGISPWAVASAFVLRIPDFRKAAPEVRPIAPAAPKVIVTAAPPPNLTIPPGSLDQFFAALRRADGAGQRPTPQAIVRVLHYGDSPTTADSITADVRKLLQSRFGDAGHGFLLIAKPWEWYGHNGIDLDAKGWKIEPASQSRAN